MLLLLQVSRLAGTTDLLHTASDGMQELHVSFQQQTGENLSRHQARRKSGEAGPGNSRGESINARKRFRKLNRSFCSEKEYKMEGRR